MSDDAVDLDLDLDAEVDAWNVTLRVTDRRSGEAFEQVYQTIPLDDDHHILKVGSSPLVDITLAGDGVAGHSCTLIVNDVGYTWLRPSDERGATLPTVGGTAIADTVRFEPGSVVEVGAHSVTLVARPVAAKPTWKLAFRVEGRRDRQTYHQLPPSLEVFHRDRVVVGRTARGADLVLPGGNVSRRHCTFYMRGDQLCLKDGGSTNGMWVNGMRAVNITFGLKDKLFVGDFVVSLAQEPVRVPTQE